MSTEKKYYTNCSLDELDACYDCLESKPAPSEETKKEIRSWIRKQKEVLSGYAYKGELRKIKRGCA